MSKYTKREIDGKLGLGDSLTREKKRKIIRDLFRKWNARTNLYHSTQEELKEAQIMLEWCAAGMELYKSKTPHKRKYKKTPKKLKKIVKKKKPISKAGNTSNKQTNDDDDDKGCLW